MEKIIKIKYDKKGAVIPILEIKKLSDNEVKLVCDKIEDMIISNRSQKAYDKGYKLGLNQALIIIKERLLNEF